MSGLPHPVMDTARVIQVVQTTLRRRGEGTEGDPVRVITQYWTLDGELLAEVDPGRVNPVPPSFR